MTQLFYLLPPLLTTFVENFNVVGPILLFMKKALEIKEDDVLLAREVLDYYTGSPCTNLKIYSPLRFEPRMGDLEAEGLTSTHALLVGTSSVVLHILQFIPRIRFIFQLSLSKLNEESFQEK